MPASSPPRALQDKFKDACQEGNTKEAIFCLTEIQSRDSGIVIGTEALHRGLEYLTENDDHKTLKALIQKFGLSKKNTPDTLLQNAAKHGSKHCVNILLQWGEVRNAHLAAENAAIAGHKTIATLLIEKFKLEEKSPSSAIHCFAALNLLHRLKKLLEKIPEPNVCSQTFLILAAKGNDEGLKLLLNSGAKLPEDPALAKSILWNAIGNRTSAKTTDIILAHLHPETLQNLGTVQTTGTLKEIARRKSLAAAKIRNSEPELMP